MSLYENMLLSKIIDEQNFFLLGKHNVNSHDFTVTQDVYKFIEKYVQHNNGQVPDYRTVVQETQFEYEPEVSDTVKFLCKRVKDATAKRQAYQMLQEQAVDKFTKLDGTIFVQWLQEETERIVKDTDWKHSAGTDFANNGLERKQEYFDSKENRSHIVVPSPWESLNKLLEIELSDYLLLQAYTNRGKSWIASLIGSTAWQNGFTVMHYSPELSKKQQLDRLDTLTGHYNNKQLKRGQLDNEQEYLEYLGTFQNNDTSYMVKTMDDIELLSVNLIEQDLKANEKIQVVIIDGFNLMHHAGKDKNTRNNMAGTSRKLRQLFGKYNVLGIVVHQLPTSAEKENMSTDEVGNRVPTVARIDQYSETIAVIQDASTVLNFDQCDGIGKIGIAKARADCVGHEIDLLCNFNTGYITEHVGVGRQDSSVFEF